jgi:hypothetical protein
MVASPQAPLGSSSHLSSKYQSQLRGTNVTKPEYWRDQRCWNQGSRLHRLGQLAQPTWLLEGVSQLSHLGLHVLELAWPSGGLGLAGLCCAAVVSYHRCLLKYCVDLVVIFNLFLPLSSFSSTTLRLEFAWKFGAARGSPIITYLS